MGSTSFNIFLVALLGLMAGPFFHAEEGHNEGGPSCRQIAASIVKGWHSGLKFVPWHQLMYVPKKRLAASKGVEIVGFLQDARAFRPFAQVLAEKIHNFDQYMQDLGFIRPKFSRIVFFDKWPWWRVRQASGGGAYVINDLVFNLWKAKMHTVIVIEPGLGRSNSLPKFVRDGGTIFHERVHTFMFRTYGRKGAYTNYDLTIQEALADFLTAHHLGNPLLGKDTLIDGLPVRDISEKIDYEIRTSDSVPGVRANIWTLGKFGQHHDSLFLSNILWKMRQQIGVVATSQMIKPFVDNLNLYYTSFYESFFIYQEVHAYGLRFMRSVEYFLAVLKRTVRDEGLGRGVADIIDRMILKMAMQLPLDPNRIDAIAQGVVKGEADLEYGHVEELKIGAVSSVVVTGKLIREGLELFIGKLPRE